MKTFNNKNNYLKKYGGNINELTTKINKTKNNLNSNLDKVKINISNTNNGVEISNILQQNLQVEGVSIIKQFVVDFNKAINEYIQNNKIENITIDDYNLLINNKLNPVILSKIINGKIGNKNWPPKNQVQLCLESLKTINTKNEENNSQEEKKSQEKKGFFSGLTGKMSGLLHRNTSASSNMSGLSSKMPGLTI